MNPGLVFYHFGSVADLLLAGLDEVSRRRMERYSAAVDGAATPAELLAVATEIFREDLDEGYVTVLAEMIAGAGFVAGARRTRRRGDRAVAGVRAAGDRDHRRGVAAGVARSG